MGKNRIFRSLVNYVKIDLETRNFSYHHVVVQTDEENFKSNRCLEDGFLEPLFFDDTLMKDNWLNFW